MLTERIERWATAALLALAAGTVAWTEALWDWDQVVYDRYVAAAGRDQPGDLLLVAIDEYSLAAVDAATGKRWPWPRAIHAQLLEQLTVAGARAVFLDVLFTEPDRDAPENDAALAGAMRAAGNVVLPVHLAPLPTSGAGAARHALVVPLPEFAAAAAALGHTHSPFGRDGILREASLALASGQQRIPHASLAVASLVDAELTRDLPGARAPDVTGDGWFEDYTTRFRFAGPPGHLPAIAYAQLLGMGTDELASLVAGRVVFVGATAPGMDMIPTPVSGTRPMPGVEVNANVFLALRDGQTIGTVSGLPLVLATILAVLVPYLLFSRLAPRYVFPFAATAIALPVAASVAALASGFWLAPMAAVTGASAAYLIWSFRRLGNAVRFLTLELHRLERETAALAPASAPGFHALAAHAATLMDLRAAGIYRGDGVPVEVFRPARDDTETGGSGAAAAQGGGSVPVSTWLHRLDADGTELRVEIARDELTPADEHVLRALAQHLGKPRSTRAFTAVERIEQRIAQVRAASAGLSELRQFVAESLEQMASGIIVAEPLGRIREANVAAARFAGIAAAQARAGSIIDVMRPIRFSGESLADLLRVVQINGTPAFGYAQSADGHDLIVQLTPWGIDSSAPYGAIVSMSDISELRASERRRAEMLGFISHDLRSPLVSTLALTQIAALKPERLQDGTTVARIEDNVRRTLELADDFLHLARAQSSEELETNDVDLAACAATAVAQVAAQAEQKSIALSDDIHGPIVVRGESGLLERAITNLLTNAIKYSGEGARVRVVVDADADAASVAVSDTGLGIPDDALPTLFDRFTRVDASAHRARGGAGLGLAFVHTVAQRHGGSVSVRSRLGEGSTFTLSVPLASTSAD